MSHPARLPDLFLDRSLGRITVPSLPRDAGLRLLTLSEHYGIPADEEVADEEWLELAGRNGWVVLMKDKRIRYNRRERDVVKAFQVRCFCLASQRLTGEEMARRYLRNLNAMTRACKEEGPFIYAVHHNRIERLALGAN